ncbi:sterol desaturase family protein [Kaistia granuli]|uniref:sterol desaturase family protein n=1 Tax=Kaistia granuli TaxID=363259 RepID=UPI00036194F8|nr:sterol desaturase family protein [Kaistia granuli]
MQLRPVTYYSDFIVYPATLAALILAAILWHGPLNPLLWIVAYGVGLFVWTLAEYLIHRGILHNMVYFRDLHEKHHARPTDLIGTPVWLSFLVIAAAVFWPSWRLFGLGIASGFTAGVVTGYVGYSFVHHVLHHWRMPHDSYLYKVKRRHALHHHSELEGNFGVTTLFWDHVFGTALPEHPGQPKPSDRT